jgi:SAM-dependent methyltransferase
MSETARLRETWDSLGREDPMWAVMTQPGKRNAWNADDFYRTGEVEISTELEWVESIGADLPAKGIALDFGCGLGRLTQPLAKRFGQAIGVDIATSMIEGARAANGLGDSCRFVVNEREDLSFLDDASVDFVFSHIVLQHMPPPLAERYIREFVRVLKAGRHGYFQMNEYSRNPIKRFLIEHAPVEQLYWMIRHRSRPPFEMHGCDLGEVRQVLRDAGAEVTGVRTRPYGRWWLDHRIVFQRRSDR